jgi:hypothetical protein
LLAGSSRDENARKKCRTHKNVAIASMLSIFVHAIFGGRDRVAIEDQAMQTRRESRFAVFAGDVAWTKRRDECVEKKSRPHPPGLNRRGVRLLEMQAFDAGPGRWFRTLRQMEWLARHDCCEVATVGEHLVNHTVHPLLAPLFSHTPPRNHSFLC